MNLTQGSDKPTKGNSRLSYFIVPDERIQGFEGVFALQCPGGSPRDAPPPDRHKPQLFQGDADGNPSTHSLLSLCVHSNSHKFKDF